MWRGLCGVQESGHSPVTGSQQLHRRGSTNRSSFSRGASQPKLQQVVEEEPEDKIAEMARKVRQHAGFFAPPRAESCRDG